MKCGNSTASHLKILLLPAKHNYCC